MDDQYVIAALVLVVAMVLRIWIVRPMGLAMLCFFALQSILQIQSSPIRWQCMRLFLFRS